MTSVVYCRTFLHFIYNKKDYCAVLEFGMIVWLKHLKSRIWNDCLVKTFKDSKTQQDVFSEQILFRLDYCVF